MSPGLTQLSVLAPVSCPRCGRTGYPGWHPFVGTYPHIDEASGVWHTETLTCSCGHRFDVSFDMRLHALSESPFSRWFAASNAYEAGTVDITIGTIAPVRLKEPCDLVGLVLLRPVGEDAPRGLVLKELIAGDGGGIDILSAWAPGTEALPQAVRVQVHWQVFGLRGIEALNIGRVQFYAAMIHAKDRLWKPALLEYASAFEAYVERYLHGILARRFGEQAAHHLLSENKGIEGRVTGFLRLVAGYELKDEPDLFRDWQEAVQQRRNKLAHGVRMGIGAADVERAHQAVYRAIDWMDRHPVSF